MAKAPPTMLIKYKPPAILARCGGGAPAIHFITLESPVRGSGSRGSILGLGCAFMRFLQVCFDSVVHFLVDGLSHLLCPVSRDSSSQAKQCGLIEHRAG